MLMWLMTMSFVTILLIHVKMDLGYMLNICTMHAWLSKYFNGVASCDHLKRRIMFTLIPHNFYSSQF